jgi:DNA-binding response OmpR family regulator
MTKSKGKILIIDDEHVVRESVRMALQHAGYDVVTLEAPATARLVVRTSKPDAIIMDLYMPELNGIELCRELKKDPQTKHIPIMIFTGSTEPIDVVGGIDAGAFEYIGKPIDPKVLVEKIKGALEGAAKRKEAGNG